MPILVNSGPNRQPPALLLGAGALAYLFGASMATIALQPTPPLAADGAALAHALHCAGVTKASAIRVTGPAGPTAVLWLYRHGYEHADYVHAHWVATMGSVDALLVPHACGAQELADLLQDAKWMREGAVVIVQTLANDSSPGHHSIPDLLEPLGYQIERCLSDKGRNVCIARLGGMGFKKAA